MRVISKSRLRTFWDERGHEDARGTLTAWYGHVNSRSVAWHSWGDLKSDFPTASPVGNCVVFNIGGNKYRLITRVFYSSQKVFVLKVLTHREYDEDRWKKECGCYSRPPKPASRASKRKPSKPKEA